MHVHQVCDVLYKAVHAVFEKSASAYIIHASTSKFSSWWSNKLYQLLKRKNKAHKDCTGLATDYDNCKDLGQLCKQELRVEYIK